MASLDRLINRAMKREVADLLIRNARIVHLISGEIEEGNLALADGKIIGIGDYEANAEYDAGGAFLAPGLIDAHIHIESSYLCPERFAEIIVPHGTTTLIADPHEIVNVCGLDGLRYMQKAAGQTPLSVFYMIPSCVPATALDDSGAIVRAEDMLEVIDDPLIPGLGEFMDFQAVIAADPDALAKIELARSKHKVIDGHSPGLGGTALNAYAAAGISTDHECSTLAEMQDRLRRGFYVQLRQGSACRNLEALIPGITRSSARHCLLCSDDRQAHSVFEEGHLEGHLRLLVAAGIPAPEALAMASLNCAECYGLSDRGLIAPGRRADLLLFEDLQQFRVRSVFIGGRLQAENGRALFPTKLIPIDNVCESMHLNSFNVEQLEMHLKSDRCLAIEMQPGGVLSKRTIVNIRRNSRGDFIFDPEQDVVKAAVLERHHNSGLVGLGLIKAYGLKRGAIAASVAHDSHNIIAVGASNEEMSTAICALRDQGGGFVLVREGRVLAGLPLPIAGLMSQESGEVLAAQLAELHRLAIEELGVHAELEPLMTLTFMSLIVIPELKLTCRGLFDVLGNRFVPSEAE